MTVVVWSGGEVEPRAKSSNDDNHSDENKNSLFLIPAQLRSESELMKYEALELYSVVPLGCFVSVRSQFLSS